MAQQRAKKSRKSESANRILNCLPSRDTENDWTMAAAVASGTVPAAAIPPSKDLRANWWSIGDQGSTGSCVGWASGDSVVRWHLVQNGKLTQTELISPRYIWMASKETDIFVSRPTTFIETEGTSLKAALDIARSYGVVLDSVLPFSPEKLYPGDANTFYALAAQRRISSYFNLGLNLADWRNWLANQGPILTRLTVDQTWDNASNTAGKLAKYKPYPPGHPRAGGHAIALVGYTPKHFIVRNSWATSWGDIGFAYASNLYAGAAFTEAYGVTV